MLEDGKETRDDVVMDQGHMGRVLTLPATRADYVCVSLSTVPEEDEKKSMFTVKQVSNQLEIHISTS